MVAAATYSLVGSGGGAGNVQITIGGQYMQSLGTVQLPSITEFVEFFVLWNPPVGTSQTVTAFGFGFNGAGVGSVSFESASYIGATDVSATPVTNSGSGTALSLSVPSALAGTLAVAAFSAGDVAFKNNTALSAFTKTQRGNTTVQVDSAQYGYQSLAFGDAVGGSGGVTFGVTGANSSAEWAAGAIVLSATSTIGSGFRAYRTNTATGGVTAGNNQLVWYNLANRQTADYSYNSTTGVLTVANAGWYKVKISFLTDNYTSALIGPILYQNGSVVECGSRIAPSVSSCVIADSFHVYCSAGDTLQAGVFAGVSFATTLIGESTGTQNVFSVSLMNRSLL
jgi:hypothetical protein